MMKVVSYVMNFHILILPLYYFFQLLRCKTPIVQILSNLSEEVDYVNGNFAPCHLQQLYLAQFSHELPHADDDNDTAAECTKG